MQTQTLHNLEFTIEHLRGMYKKFVDSTDEYPILGVTFPTHYGYIKGYASEDGHDLDVFVGNGDMYGYVVMTRDDSPTGNETKTIVAVDQAEWDAIYAEYEKVIEKMEELDGPDAYFGFIQQFKK